MNIGKYIQLYSEDLRLKNYSDCTIQNYCSQVRLFLEYFDDVATKPSEISERQIKQWLLLAKSINSRKHRLSAVKLFYELTGKQPFKLSRIEYPRAEKHLPIVLSQDEVQKMFDVCKNTKHKVILALLYSCGMRASELINLKWQHIDRSRRIINIISGKGKKDRQVKLSDSLIPLLEKYYYLDHPKEFVLNGQFGIQYSQSSLRQVIKQIAQKAGISKRTYTHLLRHCCFTHMVENGMDINLIQKIAGHSSVKTTMIYCHISDSLIAKTHSPLENIIL